MNYMKINYFYLVIFIQWCIRFSEGLGEICEFPGGVIGHCLLASECLSQHGVVEASIGGASCQPAATPPSVCCRKPFEIAETLCSSWQSYWRDNEGKCVTAANLVVGGEEAKVGQFPEIAALGVKQRRGVRWECGGTLISPHFVLTAAHCVLQFVNYTVSLGDHYIFEREIGQQDRLIGPLPIGLYGLRELQQERRNVAPTKQEILVKEIYIHPKYDRPYHDIAILQLEKAVIITKRVLPACLPISPDEDFLNDRLTVAGWGRTRYDSLQLSETLQKVSFPAIERIKCWRDLERLNPLLIPKGITQELLCAGEPGKDSCKGDSGGPLVAQKHQDSVPCEHTIAGIVSFGSGCGHFGVYTRVSSYMDWITRIIFPGFRARTQTTTPSSTTQFPQFHEIVFPN